MNYQDLILTSIACDTGIQKSYLKHFLLDFGKCKSKDFFTPLIVVSHLSVYSPLYCSESPLFKLHCKYFILK